MMLGPQIVSSVFLATSRRPVPNSLAYLGGITLGLSIGLTVSFVSAKLINSGADEPGTGGSAVFKWLIVGGLVYLSIRAYRGRHEVETPEWMTALQEAEPGAAFKLGLLLILLMPTDIIVMLAVGEYLVLNDLALIDALGFALATLLLAGAPLIGYVLVGARAEEALPKIRDWMNEKSWLISIIVYGFFIYAFLS
jgi:threonine/homoserine/homoserine lactone efflux protein